MTEVRTQCEFVNEANFRCPNRSRPGSPFCRRCELEQQRKYKLLGYPVKDFLEKEKPSTEIKVALFFLTVSVSSTVRDTFLRALEFSGKASISNVSLSDILLLLSLCLNFMIMFDFYLGLFLLLVSYGSSDLEKKRRYRTKAWKIAGYRIFYTVCAFLFVTWLYGYSIGWKTFSDTMWFGMTFYFFVALLTGMIRLMWHNPYLYFNKSLSVSFGFTTVFTGFFIAISSEKVKEFTFLNLLSVCFLIAGLETLNKVRKGKRTIVQQIIASIYSLPDIISKLVTHEQRRMALTIGIIEFNKLTSLQQKELKNYLSKESDPTAKNKVLDFLKFIVITFLIALLIEAPASYLFDRFIEAFFK